MSYIPEPQTCDELLKRLADISGITLGTLAQKCQLAVPDSLNKAKGWTGQLLERLLGASAASRAEPDFRAIGVEMKTIPVNSQGMPMETTYVCTVPLAGDIEPDWQSSWIRRKLSHVLWIPVESDKSIPVIQRRIGSGILWQPSPQQDAALKQDWEEHMELISSGRIHDISAHYGTYLQIRPKAANSRALRDTTDEEGNIIQTLPRGFYLRTSFTRLILEENFLNTKITLIQ